MRKNARQMPCELVMDWMGVEGSLVTDGYWSFAHGFSFKNMFGKMLEPLRSDIFFCTPMVAIVPAACGPATLANVTININ